MKLFLYNSIMKNYYLNSILLDKVIDKEIDTLKLTLNEEERDILRIKYIELYNSYKNNSYDSKFWKKYYKYLQSKEWKALRKEVFIRDGYKCLLCGDKANHCHHLSYGSYIKHGNSKRIECASLCKKCHNEVHGIKSRT